MIGHRSGAVLIDRPDHLHDLFGLDLPGEAVRAWPPAGIGRKRPPWRPTQILPQRVLLDSKKAVAPMLLSVPSRIGRWKTGLD